MLVGVSCVVGGGVGRGGEGWRGVGGMEECGGRGGVCAKGGVLEGVRCVGGEEWMWVVGG